MSEEAAALRPGPWRRLAGFFLAWRDWPGALVRAWNRSLQFRTVLVTMVLSGLAVALTSVAMSQSIAGDLFQTRLTQVLEESRQATSYAQSVLDDLNTSNELVIADSVSTQVWTAIGRAAPSAQNQIAIMRSPEQSTPDFLQDSSSPTLPAEAISRQLREQLLTGEESQYWQSVTLNWADDPSSPGVVVATRLQVPVAGQYELFTVFDFADAAATLRFIQQALLLGGLALVALISAVTWVIVRLVVRPIQTTAETSQRLAAGDLEVRLPQYGEDEISSLWRSFNEMADSIQEQITQLGTLSKVQQRFVSDVSHELRTPLTTIRMAADVLHDRRDEFDPAATRSIELLHAQVQRFELLLADLLEISSHDAGAAELEAEAVNMARLVEQVVESSSSLAAERGSELRLLALGGHGDAECDPRRVRRILRNLIDNAIEHGDGKPIVVTVDSTESAVAVAVRDWGVGISEENQQRVFERFWRADPSRTRTLGGTGLGLAISQEDAQLHGGWLQLWSAPGQGAYFLLTLPRRRGIRLTASPLPLPPEDVVDTLTADTAPVAGPRRGLRLGRRR